MYDTIASRLDKEKMDNNYFQSIPNYLSNVSYTEFEGGNYSIGGNLKNLKIRVNENNVKVSGSVSKFKFGDNINGLFRSDMENVVEEISDLLHLPLNEAKLTRIDIAHNFSMNSVANDYYKYLGEAQYYKRFEADNGLYYNNKKKQINIYGKIKEQTVRGVDIPKYYVDNKLLRYELRFRSRVADQFKRTEVLVKDLYDESFYIETIDKWIDEYFKIQKVNKIISTMKPTGSTKELSSYLACIGLFHAGYSNIYKLIKEWQNRGVISKKQASDLRKRVRKLSIENQFTERVELVEELDKKVKSISEYYR